MTTTVFASAKEVSTAIESIGFKATQETLAAISRNLRDEFLEHLSQCVSSADTSEKNKAFIGNILRCLSPKTIARSKAFVPSTTIDKVAEVAKATPTRFMSALDVAENPAHEKHEDAKAFLRSVLSCETESTNADHTACNAQEQPTHNLQQNAAPSSTSKADGKKYHSVHVYGANAALCFNATTWNGSPGVMVDAATITGPKTYDWKNAVHVWLDINEVGAVLAVLRRWRRGIEFSAHGAQNDKGFAIEFQGQHYFAKVSAKKTRTAPVRAVKILPSDAVAVSVLFLSQLAESYPMIPLTELLATVQATHQIADVATA